MRGRLAAAAYPRLIAPQVGGDQPKPLLRADDGGQLRPLRFEAFLAFDLLGRHYEVGVDLRAFGLGELELRQPACIAGAVFDRPRAMSDAM